MRLLVLMALLPATLLAGDLYTGQPPAPYQYQDTHQATRWSVVRQQERDTRQDLDRLYKDHNWDWSKPYTTRGVNGLPEFWLR